MQKITPFLWFDNNAEEAMNFYMSVFKNSKKGNIKHLDTGDSGPGPGKFITGSFELEGQEFMMMNAGPMFKFNEAISLFVNCEDQAEVDYFWDKFISGGGQESMCGWLKDKFGLSWQIVPKDMNSYIGGSDPAGAMRAMQAMMTMRKLDIGAIKKAYEGN